MKDLAKIFLSDDERARVDTAVKAAEKLSAGEIVVMIIRWRMLSEQRPLPSRWR